MSKVYLLQIDVPYHSTNVLSVHKSFEGCVGAAFAYMSDGLGLDHWSKAIDLNQEVSWECHGDYLNIQIYHIDD